MKCTNCNNEFRDGLLQCPFCGAKVNANQPVEIGYSNTQQEYTQQHQQYQQPQNTYRQDNSAPEFVMFLVFGILYCICCNIFIGIPGIIFTVIMNTEFKSNNIVGYNNNKKAAKWTYIIGLILIAVCAVAYFLFLILTGNIFMF